MAVDRCGGALRGGFSFRFFRVLNCFRSFLAPRCQYWNLRGGHAKFFNILNYINLCIDRTLATSRLRSPKIGEAQDRFRLCVKRRCRILRVRYCRTRTMENCTAIRIDEIQQFNRSTHLANSVQFYTRINSQSFIVR
uniref:Secreted protein n=1 Tax=Heterorhabditis bacteriophora TaxID=37862 RepID=A0A1I7WIG5_HETBA